MTGKKSKAELLKSAYEAFNKRDVEGILAMMHPGVDWPNAMTGGRLKGRDAVREYWQRQWSTVDPRVEPLAFQDDEDGRTIVDVHQVVRDLTGTIIVDRMVQHVYFVRDCGIERMDIRATSGPHSTQTDRVAT